MHRFLFDLMPTQPNESGDFHGGGKYTKKIFFSFFSCDQITSWTLYALFDSKRTLDNDIKIKLDERSVQLIDIKSITIKEIINKLGITKVFSALPDKCFLQNNLSVPFFSTIHGLRFIEIKTGFDALMYDENFKKKCKTIARILLSNLVKRKYYNYYRGLILNSNVIAVSNHTKYSISTYFPYLKNNIKVFYSPDVTEFIGAVDETCERMTTSNYFLLVSGNRWLKNNLRSAMALDQIFTEHKEVLQDVIITGVSEVNLFKRHLKNPERFVFYRYVSEDFLNLLYKKAFAFVYMSLNEGFGYPPLEAMKNYVPVITSPFTSIPEICGDAVLYGNPYSIQEIKNRVLQLYNEKFYSRLKIKGRAQYIKIRERQDSDLKLLINLLLEI